MAKDPRLKRAGVSGFNKPKRTPGHKTKSHVVVAKQGDKVKTIRFGQQGVKTAGKPKKGESERMKAKRITQAQKLKQLEGNIAQLQSMVVDIYRMVQENTKARTDADDNTA